METPAPRRRWARPALCVGSGLAVVLLSVSRWDAGDPGVAAGAGLGSPVVVAALDLAAGTVLTDADLRLYETAPGAVPPSAVSEGSLLSGRRLVVPLHRGDPILSGSTVAAAGSVAGHRLVRVRLSADEETPGLDPGVAVEVAAALDAQTSPSGHAEEHVVALATIVAIEPDAGTGSGANGAGATSVAPPAVVASGAGASGGVLLDCSSVDALRVLWARDFARSIRLIPHPQGDGVAPDALGPRV